MSDLVRVSLSLEKALYDSMETLVTQSGYENRSEFIRDLVRDRLVRQEWEKNEEAVGTITLVRFANASGLTSEGRNLLSETIASGAPLTGTAGQNGFGSIQQGLMERSNVQMVTELVNMITAQRAYEINSRAIRAGDEMLTTANRLVGG